jgi:hypothetical protein
MIIIVILSSNGAGGDVIKPAATEDQSNTII